MPSFLVVRGNHVEGKGATRKRYKRGDIIVTNKELDKIFQRKFRRIESGNVVFPAPNIPAPPEPMPATSGAIPADDVDKYGLLKMTKKQLLEFAEEEELELDETLSRKSEILSAIQSQLDVR